MKTEHKNIEIIFNVTGSHYRYLTLNRYRITYNYITNKYTNYSFNNNWKDKKSFDLAMQKELSSKEYKKSRLVKPDPTSSSVDDIMSEFKRGRFLIRPDYQRSEVNNLYKAFYLLESILLGIPISPLFIYRRADKIIEVIDRQQRLLTIIVFLGKTYMMRKVNLLFLKNIDLS